MKEKIILDKDVILPQKETLEVYKLNVQGAPQYVVSEEKVKYWLSTHTECKCGNIHRRTSYCNPCAERRQKDSYLKHQFKEWDGTTCVCIHNSDEYFWDPESIEEYCEENECESEDLRLMICEPNKLHEIGAEHFYEQDYWPENLDSLADFDKVLNEKLKELNAYIQTLKPISWSQGRFRTEHKYEPEWKK